MPATEETRKLVKLMDLVKGDVHLCSVSFPILQASGFDVPCYSLRVY